MKNSFQKKGNNVEKFLKKFWQVWPVTVLNVHAGGLKRGWCKKFQETWPFVLYNGHTERGNNVKNLPKIGQIYCNMPRTSKNKYSARQTPHLWIIRHFNSVTFAPRSPVSNVEDLQMKSTSLILMTNWQILGTPITSWQTLVMPKNYLFFCSRAP